jgi:hypothetical protein
MKMGIRREPTPSVEVIGKMAKSVGAQVNPNCPRTTQPITKTLCDGSKNMGNRSSFYRKRAHG